MADESMQFWEQARETVRRALNLDPLCQEESEKEYKKAKPADPLSEADINAIMDFVLSCGETAGMTVGSEPVDAEDEPQPKWRDPVSAEDMDSELMELVNRNRGEQDEDVERLLDEHRKKELADGQDSEESPDQREDTP